MVDDITVHATAVVAEEARLGRGTIVDPYAVIGSDVVLGEDCWVGSHAVLCGHVRAGARNRFFPGAIVGQPSQDVWETEGDAWVSLGDDNIIRESVTINAGTSKEFRCTSIGNGNLIMAGCHVAHDCVIDDGTILANNVLLGGHVRIRSHASVGGGAALHHFVSVGRFAFVGGLTRVIHDVPPWLIIEGHPGRIKAVNLVGAQRQGVDEASLARLRHAFKKIYGPEGEGNRTGVLHQLREEADLTAEVEELLEALERQATGLHGRFLERFRQEDRSLDTQAIPPPDRPRMIP